MRSPAVYIAARRNRDTVAAQKKIFNENLVLSPAESLRREGAANASVIMSGPGPRALQKWVDMQRAGNGDSVFLTEREPWMRGEVVDLNAAAEALITGCEARDESAWRPGD
jgi:enoyl-CoA hydratase